VSALAPRRRRTPLALALVLGVTATCPLAAGCGSTQRYPLLMPAEAATDLFTHLETEALARRYPVRRGSDWLEVSLPDGDTLQYRVEEQDRNLFLTVTVNASGLGAEATRVRHEQRKKLADELVDAAKASAARGRTFE
jgi:hypothetical protein